MAFGNIFNLPSNNDPGYEKATLTIDNTGSVTGDRWTNSWNQSGGISSGSITVDIDGKVGGLITYTGSPNGNEEFSDFRLSALKDVVVGLDNSRNGYYSLVLATKTGGSFTTSDLDGRWYYFGFWDEKAPTSGSAGWTRVDAIVNANGDITSGSGSDSEGDNFSIGGSMNIKSNGVVDLNVTATSGSEIESTVIVDLQMTLNKTMISGVFVDDPEEAEADIGIMIKAGSNYSTPDLEGSWYAFSYEDRENGHDPDWTRSKITLDSLGNVTAGEDVEADGSTSTISSGSLNIDSGGMVSGTIDGESFSNFQMDSSKKYIVGVESDEPDNERLIVVIVKAASVPPKNGSIIVPVIQPLLMDD